MALPRGLGRKPPQKSNTIFPFVLFNDKNFYRLILAVTTSFGFRVLRSLSMCKHSGTKYFGNRLVYSLKPPNSARVSPVQKRCTS